MIFLDFDLQPYQSFPSAGLMFPPSEEWTATAASTETINFTSRLEKDNEGTAVPDKSFSIAFVCPDP